MKTKRVALIVIVTTVSALFFGNVWQTFAYRTLEKTVGDLDAEQRRLLEENKQVIANISIYGSPARIDEIARKELKLKKLDTSQILRLQVKDKGKGRDG